jgi:membrane protein insertase Oxa1/YidC/SpoIIIJ
MLLVCRCLDGRIGRRTARRSAIRSYQEGALIRFSSPAVNATGPKATRIDLFSFSTPQMRAFHLTWMAFFICFFAWFAAAPLMPLIKNTFGLSKGQIENINIAAVSVTIFVRLLIGPLCDKYGPRRFRPGGIHGR